MLDVSISNLSPHEHEERQARQCNSEREQSRLSRHEDPDAWGAAMCDPRLIAHRNEIATAAMERARLADLFGVLCACTGRIRQGLDIYRDDERREVLNRWHDFAQPDLAKLEDRIAELDKQLKAMQLDGRDLLEVIYSRGQLPNVAAAKGGA